MKELANFKVSKNKILSVMCIDKVEENLLNECAYSLSKQENPVDVLILTKGLTDEDSQKVKSIFEKPSIRIVKQDQDGNPVQETLTSETTINFAVEKTDKNTYPEFFNEAFNYAVVNGYEFVSPIEYDDVLDFKWYKNVQKYSETKTNIDAFFPITREISGGNFIGFFNEATWAEGLAEFAGFADLQMLLRFNCLNFTGAVYKVNSVKEYSQEVDGVYKPMKELIKISFAYEFFLRMIYNDLKFYTIPRIGYERRVDRGATNSITCKISRKIHDIPVEQGGMTQEEMRWWIDLAKKEYFYDDESLRKEDCIYKPDLLPV